MQRPQVQRSLVGLAGGLAHRSQQQRATGDGFHAARRVRCPAVPTPPVVDKGAGPGHCLAALGVLCGEAAQTPLVFQLIEGFLRIGAVAPR